MGNRKKKVFFKKQPAITSLALHLCPRGMCECLVTGWLGTGYLQWLFGTVVLVFFWVVATAKTITLELSQVPK